MAWCARLALLMAVLASLLVQPAGAQSFLESLFGSDGPSPSRPARDYVRTKPSSSMFDRLFSPSPYDAQPHVRASTYRTLCVRMCDGFYFPVSFATSSANFAQDAAKCEASCGGARLFYYPNPGGDIEGMLDMTGRAYASYPIAFKYRKTLVEGCQCRPQPWTETERARHNAYAAALMPGNQTTGNSVQTTQAGFPVSGADGKSMGLAAPPPINRDDFEGPAYRASSPAVLESPGDARAASSFAPVQPRVQGKWEWLPNATSGGQFRSYYSVPGTR